MIELIENKRIELAELCRRYKVRRLEIFGSAAKEKHFRSDDSDLDFIVEFEPVENRKYFDDYMGLLDDLKKLFGCKIDLVANKEFRNPYFRKSVDETRTTVYGL